MPRRRPTWEFSRSHEGVPEIGILALPNSSPSLTAIDTMRWPVMPRRRPTWEFSRSHEGVPEIGWVRRWLKEFDRILCQSGFRIPARGTSSAAPPYLGIFPAPARGCRKLGALAQRIRPHLVSGRLRILTPPRR